MKRSTLKIFGSVLTVLEGNVAEDNLLAVRPKDLHFALGGSSFSGPTGIGETILIGGTAHISWVEDSQLRTEEHEKFRCAFLMGVDDRQIASDFILYRPASPVSMQALYAELAGKYPDGFAILGSVRMAEMQATYLKKPPIFHENINQKHEDYWAPVTMEKQKAIAFFGVVIPPKAREKYSSVLEKAFYHNPGEVQSSPFDSHTHAAILQSGLAAWPKSMDEFLQSLQGQRITGVRHLLTQSLIQEGVYALFPIENINT